MKKLCLITAFLLLYASFLSAQVTIRGTVLDKKTHKGVRNAKVYTSGNQEENPYVTDQSGYFELKLLPSLRGGETFRLIVNAPGYEEFQLAEIVSEKPIDNVFLEKKIPDHPTIKKIALGQNYQGGIIFYLESDKKHGLIAAETDQSLDSYWWIRSTALTNYSYSMIDGASNTSNIVDDQGNTGAYAALLCKNYKGGGYTDWFLPAQDQLDTLYKYRNFVGTLKKAIYWTSTANGTNVWFRNFEDGKKWVDYPSSRHVVRAIRAF